MQGSYALAVDPSEVNKVQSLAKRLGVPTDFTGDGRPIFSSPGHKRDYCRKVEGHMTGHKVVDRNAGYMDSS